MFKKEKPIEEKHHNRSKAVITHTSKTATDQTVEGRALLVVCVNDGGDDSHETNISFAGDSDELLAASMAIIHMLRDNHPKILRHVAKAAVITMAMSEGLFDDDDEDDDTGKVFVTSKEVH